MVVVVVVDVVVVVVDRTMIALGYTPGLKGTLPYRLGQFRVRLEMVTLVETLPLVDTEGTEYIVYIPTNWKSSPGEILFFNEKLVIPEVSSIKPF